MGPVCGVAHALDGRLLELLWYHGCHSTHLSMRMQGVRRNQGKHVLRARSFQPCAFLTA